MWNTSDGERILKNSEALVFAESLWSFIDESNLNDYDDYDIGITVFDNLTYGQKICVLSIIGTGLLKEDVPPVELTAVLEGAIAAVFIHLMECIEIEIDEPDFSNARWREKVFNARKEMIGEDIPLPDCDDLEEWKLEVDSLHDRILWDTDYASESSFVDGSRENTKLLKTLAGVSNDYYISIADDLNENEIENKLLELRSLCRGIVEGK